MNPVQQLARMLDGVNERIDREATRTIRKTKTLKDRRTIKRAATRAKRHLAAVEKRAKRDGVADQSHMVATGAFWAMRAESAIWMHLATVGPQHCEQLTKAYMRGQTRSASSSWHEKDAKRAYQLARVIVGSALRKMTADKRVHRSGTRPGGHVSNRSAGFLYSAAPFHGQQHA